MSPAEQRLVDRPLFARVYERFSQGAEKRGLADLRRRVLSGLHGTVLEVGAGNGLNFAYYPTTVEKVIAIEPEPYLRERATGRAEAAPVPVEVVAGTAEHLPLDDHSVEAAVVSLVLCSVPDQAVALAELRRVLRPGGELRVLEHVVSERQAIASIQTAFTHVAWKHFAGGCHMDRDTGGAIRAAGFTIDELDRVRFQGLGHLVGVAHAPAG